MRISAKTKKLLAKFAEVYPEKIPESGLLIAASPSLRSFKPQRCLKWYLNRDGTISQLEIFREPTEEDTKLFTLTFIPTEFIMQFRAGLI